MQLNIHNTLAGKKETFEPIDPNHIKMYVCGPTVYNFVHIGNARPVVVFDVLFRLLQQLYPNVTYARNITDVDDKINKAAKDNGESIAELAGRYAQAYHQDMDKLNALPPTLEPYATHNIDKMIEVISDLITHGHAYEAEGHVLFSVPSMPAYGKLSNRAQEDLIAGASERVEEASYKRDQSDFVLWKPSTEDLPGWDSPWGRGRPGWHIECTAMIKAHLGDTIDIHGGGQDLIFPHHENEIAQGVCCTEGQQYVRYWMHNGYLTIDGEKMSKSLGNFHTVRDLLEKFDGEVLRFALLKGHYRGPLDFSPTLLEQAKAELDRMYTALRETADIVIDTSTLNARQNEAVFNALCDDLNTPQAIAAMHEVATALNKASNPLEKAALKTTLLAGAQLLGLLSHDVEFWFKQGGAADGLSDSDIDALIEERKQARVNKDFARSDAIRDQLKEAGIVLEDTPQGTRWSRA